MGAMDAWNKGMQLLQAALLFGLVLVLAYVTTRLVGRRMSLASPGRSMRLVDQLPLGQGRGMFLVEVGGRLLLLGVSEGSVSLLLNVVDPAEVQAFLSVAEAPAGQGVLGEVGAGFAARLRSALDRTATPPVSSRPEAAPPEAELPDAIRSGLWRLKRLRLGRSSNEQR